MRDQRDLLVDVTHELRAPLSSTSVALQILKSELGAGLSLKQAHFLAVALSNCDRMAGMIDGILDSAKFESGHMTLLPKPVKPWKAAEEAIDSLRPLAHKKKLSLTLLVLGDLPLVYADAERTMQILVNLLSNAIKFTPAGGRIEVMLSKRVEGGSTFVQCGVSDTGPGIPQADHQRVFEKFAQSSAPELRRGGTGLGLSIAKELVRLQNGRMWLNSEPGRGSTFSFTLPAFAAQAYPVHAPCWDDFVKDTGNCASSALPC